MYTHFGGDILIRKNEIIAIIDLETVVKNSASGSFLNHAKNNEKIRYISEKGKEKSLVVTTGDYYFSPISTTTLYKRARGRLQRLTR